MMNKIGKVISTVFCTASVLMMLWIGASWVDIVWDNTSPNPTHSPYNAFVMLVEHAK